MPIVMHMEWPSVTQEQYNEALQRVDWENNIPDGAMLHIVGWDKGVMQVIDVWESEDNWHDFLGNRLTPALQQMNMPGEPSVRMYPSYRIFDAAKAAVTV
jgi:hypothetical protein